MRLSVAIVCCLLIAGCLPKRSRSSIDGIHTAKIEADPSRQGVIPAAGTEAVVEHTVSGTTFIPPLPEADRPAIELTLESLEQLALANHPALRQADAIVAQARGKSEQVGRTANPRVSFVADDINEGGSAGRYGIQWNRTFIREEKLQSNRDVMQFEIERVSQQRDRRRLQILTDLRLEFVAILGLQKRIAILNDLAEATKKTIEQAKKLEMAGDVAPVDVRQLEITRQRDLLARDAAKAEMTQRRKTLAALIGVQHLPEGDLIGSLEEQTSPGPGFDGLLHQLMAASPQVQAARFRISRADARVRQEQLRPLPNVFGQVGIAHDFADDRPILGIQVGVPIPAHNQKSENIAAARAALYAATQDLKRIEQSLRVRLAQALQQQVKAKTIVAGFAKTIVPQSLKALETIRKTYAEGEIELARLLAARRDYFEAQQTLLDARIDLLNARTRIDGLLESGGLAPLGGIEVGDELRDAALSSQ